MAVEEDPAFIGIDLGTTFSSIVYYDTIRKEPVLIEDETGKEQTASWISLSQLDTGGSVVVGNVARNSTNLVYVIYDSKRIIGKNESDVNYEDRERWPFDVRSRDNGCAYIECYNPLTQNTEGFEPEEVSGMILKYLYGIAQNKLGNRPISNVVVTVPVDFNDRQRDATLLACKLAGIKNVSLANEPTAAIIEYKREYPNSLKGGDKIVVIDFGGGTLDVTCCKIANDSIIVESCGGNQNLGGNDFDNVMIDIIKERIKESIPGYYKRKRGMTQKEKIILNKKLIRLKKESERVKIKLSNKTVTELNLELLLSDDYYDIGINIDPTITRKAFEEECDKRGLYKEFINKIQGVTLRKGYKKRTVQLVLLIGGTCKMPRIREEVASLFDRQTFSDKNFNPLSAVAKGAGYLAYSKGVDCVSNKIVYDIVPTPIGIEVEGGIFESLIKAGEAILPKNVIRRRYSTTVNNQTYAKFKIYRGFGKYTNSDGMEYITTLTINGIPKRKTGKCVIEFTTQVNENGIMELTASVVGTDVKTNLTTVVDLSKTEEEVEQLFEHFQMFY
ncbi:heat shock protein 70kD, putative [Entamoeba dispar SAW760]|uniref:Heat shock protein 70kD, putative n=1 Tax=Entamoeba dispar (strain ATCC PRA-260 / SAW760) TaxID=370354 RepID=B0EAH5_ENTDS|nr:heat shock protein 70kD, putative [Entamoeba dispar SAW760]EDR28488.1 heat shock protein 70kD, putative [Entamoeba dispar SAW760]|eukprot:EDR28488.1 heat shock protein 70kD, putative [Entamoeba dispar SAW760]